MKKKYLILFSAIGILFVSCQSDEKKGLSTNDVNITGSSDGNNRKGELPVMLFEEEVHDFGKITQGEKVSYSFKFKNTGKSNLVIASAQGSCGCTVAQPPKEPIAPDSEGKIDVVFDSNGKSGSNQKTVTVITNCEPNTKILTIKAEVIVPTENEPNKTKK